MRCDRCKKETKVVKMSWFNTEMICPECQAEENKRPDIKLAKKMELEHVKAGDYNFAGIGLR